MMNIEIPPAHLLALVRDLRPLQEPMKENAIRKVELFDTSLRDGLQQPDLEISVPNAVLLLQRMAAFGVRYAEIGFAGANQFVSDLTAALDSVDTGAMRLALFGRTRGRGAKVEDWPDVQFIVRHKHRIPAAVIVVKSRLLDVERSLETTPEENLLMTRETIDCLQQHGLEVLVDFEHAMDASCGRRENGAPCDARFRPAQPRLLPPARPNSACGKKSAASSSATPTAAPSPEEVSQVIVRRSSAIFPPRTSAFTATPIAASASPTRAPRFWPARAISRARSSAPASAAAT